MSHKRLLRKKARRLTAPARIRGCGHTHRHLPAGPWVVFWLLVLGMLR